MRVKLPSWSQILVVGPAFLAAAVIGFLQWAVATPRRIADPALGGRIRVVAQREYGPVSTADLQSVTNLDCYATAHMHGIESCTNLQRIQPVFQKCGMGVNMNQWEYRLRPEHDFQNLLKTAIIWRHNLPRRQFLPSFEPLRKLPLREVAVFVDADTAEASLEPFCHIPTLEKLSLTGDAISAEQLQTLSGPVMEAQVSIDHFGRAPITISSVMALRRLKLRSVGPSNHQHSIELSHCPALTDLVLLTGNSVTVKLRAVPSLLALTLHSDDRTTQYDIPDLPSSLRYLRLCDNPRSLEPLVDLPAVREVVLQPALRRHLTTFPPEETSLVDRNRPENFLAPLTRMPALESLTIETSRDEDYSVFRDSKTLKTLELRNLELADAAIIWSQLQPFADRVSIRCSFFQRSATEEQAAQPILEAMRQAGVWVDETRES